MKDSPQRVIARADFRDEPRDVRSRADIRPHDPHLHATLAKILRKGFGVRCRGAASTRQYQVPGAALDQPQREHLAEAAEGSGNQVTTIAPDRKGWRQGFAATRERTLSGNATTTLPMCLPCAMSRKAASIRHAGNERNGRGESAPCSTNSAISSSSCRASSSSPLKTASIATTWKEALRRRGQSGMRVF